MRRLLLMASFPFVQSLWQPRTLALIGGASLLLFLVSLVAVPWLLVRLPADYFTRPHVPLWPRWGHAHPVLFTAWRVLKNVAGAALLVAGVAMLFLPGQGVLTILVALGILDFPGKRRLERRLISSPRLLRAINGLRSRAGRSPLRVDWEG